MGGASVPPPPVRAPLSSSPSNGDDADTRVVPNAFDSDHAPTAPEGLPPVGAVAGGYDSFSDSDADHTSVRVDPSLDAATQQALPVAAASGAAAASAALRLGRPIDDTALLELSATTVATDIDMDWDEEEVATHLRDEGEGPLHVNAAAEPGLHGNPSPFGGRTLPPGAQGGMFGVRPGVRSSFPPPVPSQPPSGDWEDEDEAMTQVRDSHDVLAPVGAVATSWSGFPAPNSARASTVELDSPSFEEPHAKQRWPWIVLAAAAVLGAAFAAKTMQDGPGAATMTLVTKPGDAEVAIDGRTLVGQTSPFMVQDLTPGIDHEVVVRKEGFEPQTRRFRANAGQVLPLDGIELTKLDSGTGFALATAPSGAKVFVDGNQQQGVTPLRVTDLTPGLHTIRVEHPDGKPWESQVALAHGQVIDLPIADLTAVKAATKKAKSSDDDDKPAKVASASSSSSKRSSSGKSRRAAAREARASKPSAPIAARAVRAPAPIAAAPAMAAAPAAGGAEGSLRVNSRPWSQVYVDGRMIGNTPLLNVPLRAGKHKVKLVNPQLGMSKQLTVQIAKGKATTKVVDLQ